MIVVVAFPTAMRLAVVGSQHFAHPADLKRAAATVAFLCGLFKPEVVISGGAAGMDKTAVWVAKMLQLKTMEFHPPIGASRWEHFRPRNMRIAQECTHLVCIRSTTSTTYGSGWTRDYARDTLRKPTWSLLLPHDGGTIEWPDW